MSVVQVASWNVFHGRAQPPVRRDLLLDFATALADAEWDVCGLQELPPWWAQPLAAACGASLRVSRTSYGRALLPAVQRCVSAADPERLGARGAAVNALLVRPSAGEIVDHRTATLRRLPQRRTVHGVQLARAGGESLWVCNVHTHNRPASAAAADLRLALERANAWARAAAQAPASVQAQAWSASASARSGSAASPAGHAGPAGGPAAAPLIVLGDLNLPAAQARGIAHTARLTYLAGQRVDHVVGSPGSTLGGSQALRPQALDSTAALSDHRLLLATVDLPD